MYKIYNIILGKDTLKTLTKHKNEANRLVIFINAKNTIKMRRETNRFEYTGIEHRSTTLRRYYMNDWEVLYGRRLDNNFCWVRSMQTGQAKKRKVQRAQKTKKIL